MSARWRATSSLRGFLLVLLELTVIRAAWTFNIDYSGFILAGVIWMLRLVHDPPRRTGPAPPGGG